MAGAMDEDAGTSIAKNLSAVLNTKRGHGFVVQIFGMGDHDVYEEAKPRIDALVADMSDQIRRYEPRLTAVTVAFAGREGALWALFRARGETKDGRTHTFRIRWHVVFRNVEVSVDAEARRT
ncbi:GPW/gp25 family protein [Myxococcota bacterium]|nr:GPW/gp25 family protein [Myxococcota bacterium]